MNKFIQAVKDLDCAYIEELLQKEPKWIGWAEDSGKNALHYLCGVDISKKPLKAEASFQILKLLLKSGMDMNSVHKIPDGCGDFPATPLWYAYTRGRNEKLFTYLLRIGADPEHCMYAISWYDDAEAAALFKKHGAAIDDHSNGDTPFLAAFMWKRFNVAEWFLKNGADVNAADKEGNMALYYAVKRKYKIEQIQLLLKFEANFNQENNKGVSPKKLAEANKQRKILGFFKP
ncbi:MAG TPA: ankyrin repeat domain-containing protein [Mucilaginibacter sp.]|nr:ankyrin repeat domain-containing protein [Mucilaginibacter sp.]